MLVEDGGAGVPAARVGEAEDGDRVAADVDRHVGVDDELVAAEDRSFPEVMMSSPEWARAVPVRLRVVAAVTAATARIFFSTFLPSRGSGE